MQRRSLILLSIALPALAFVTASRGAAQATLGAPPVPGAKVLFDGSDLSHFTRAGSNEPAAWKVEDGTMTVGSGSIQTKGLYQDFQLHLEFMTPYMPDKHGQARGNSGVIIQRRYEIQVLDSYGKESPGTGDCGAVYSQSAALVNACKQPLEWQSYDIIFRAPRYADGKMTEKPRVTVFQNGILVQNNTEIQGFTASHNGFGGQDVSNPGPIELQDHGNPVQYRNIWIKELPLKGNEKYE